MASARQPRGQISGELIEWQELVDALMAIAAGISPGGDLSKVRPDILAKLKSSVREARAKAEQLLFEDGDGTLCARRISYIQDELIRAIYQFSIKQVFPKNNASTAENMAICAVGGYGRGTLAPGSDIDLLFVLPHKQTPWGESVVENILYFLWDMGFKVGHATRTIDECIRLSRKDMTIRTSILEMRFIDGEETLSSELSQRFQNEIVASTAPEFVSAKLEERNQRHKKSGESRYRVEPNIKDGKGGLRDLHTLFWIGKYFYNEGRSRDLVKVGFFTEAEYRRFRNAERFLWTVRCHMHFLTGRTEERLSFDIQREMAARLNYTDNRKLLAVERFMKHYFLVAKEVGDLTLIACAVLEEQQAKDVRGVNGLIRSITHRAKRIPGTSSFINSHGRINVADEAVFVDDPVNILRLFLLADKNNLDFHPDAIQLVSKSAQKIDRELRETPEANDIFLKLLTSKNGPEPILRKMNETGVLGKFIPAFGKIVAMMQFNMYHHYTVDEHLIRSVGALWGIESGHLAAEHPLSTDLLPGVADRRLLYISLLLHDIAKGGKEDHSVAGARLAKRLCPRLGLSKEQTDLVAWLIREHLTMSTIAQSRDLSDPKTIRDFADVVQTVERMRYLVILTVCDIRAVGPGVWNGWKGQLLRTLYYETEPVLTGGFSSVSKEGQVAQAKQVLTEALGDWKKSDINKVTNLPYDAYFLSTDPDAQIRHMELLRKSEAEKIALATSVYTDQFEAITEISILAPDHPRLLSIVAGACTGAGANIVDAKIHTTRDGRALDSIYISRKFHEDADELRRAETISKTIKDVLIGQRRLPDVLATNKSLRSNKQKAFNVNKRAVINNDLSETFSVVEIECLDRPGLLSEITGVLADLNLDIGSAHVVTFGEKVVDSFYVRDLVGHKIDDEKRQKQILKRLLAML